MSILDRLELDHFDLEKFNNPDSFFSPGMLWFWNDVISKEKIILQLHEMHAVGVRRVWPIPMPKNFRPNSMKTNLEPEYLSEEYLDIYKEMAKEMKKLGMSLWIYDDAGWPSGGVCGRIVREHPSWARQSLVREELKLDCGNTLHVPDDCLIGFLYKGNTQMKRLNPGEQDEIKEHGMRMEIYYGKKEGETLTVPPYPDLLNPAVTEEFIKLTHEAYKQALGDYFGDTIPFILSDEPRVDNPPWTDDLDIAFQKEKGYDIKQFLPAIFENDEEGKDVRIDFFDWWSKRFSEAYFGQIQAWCQNNSLMFIGHLGGEDTTTGPRVHGYGHVLRILRKFDVPGVDTIWRQIYPGETSIKTIKWNNNESTYPININHHFPKYASTAAHQGGKTWCWSESFSAYGSALTLEEMKWITDFQFVRGINIIIPCQMHLSTKGHYMGSMRPIFNKENPLFRHMEMYQNYAARLSYLLSLGKPDIETALYYPIRDIWGGGSELERVAESNDKLAAILLENQCDFDMIDDDLLESHNSIAANGCLEVGPMKYRTIYVSRSKYMSDKSKDKLAEFVKNSGKVLWVDNGGNPEGPEGSIQVDFEGVNEHIKPCIFVKPENKSIRVCKRSLISGNLYFLTNEDMDEVSCKVEFKETLPLIEIDPETGTCSNPENASYTNGICSLPVSLKFAGSRIFFFTNDKVALKSKITPHVESVRFLNEGWACRKIKTFKVGDEEFEVDEHVEGEFIPIELGDWRGTLGDDFSGDAEYSIEFDYSKEESIGAFLLNLGKVKGVSEVILNEHNLGTRAWQPFAYDVKDAVKEGKNKLRVIVTNTTANQFITTDKIEKWPDTVVGSYHKQCLAFEEGCTESGLYGPVKISICSSQLKDDGDSGWTKRTAGASERER